MSRTKSAATTTTVNEATIRLVAAIAALVTGAAFITGAAILLARLTLLELPREGIAGALPRTSLATDGVTLGIGPALVGAALYAVGRFLLSGQPPPPTHRRWHVVWAMRRN